MTRSSSSSTASKMIATGWLQEHLVKNHQNWVQSGVVWLLQNASITVFATNDDGDDDNDDNIINGKDESEGQISEGLNRRQQQTVMPMDTIVLISKSNLIYAWTPKDSEKESSNEMFKHIMQERLKAGFKIARGLSVQTVADNNDEDEIQEGLSPKTVLMTHHLSSIVMKTILYNLHLTFYTILTYTLKHKTLILNKH